MADLNDRIARAETRLAELREQIAEVERDEIEEWEVDAAFARFDELWSALTPREQAKIVSLLIARIEFDADDSSITLQFHPAAIKSLAQGDIA